MMNNKSVFYFTDKQLNKVFLYVQLFLNLNYIDVTQEELMEVENALNVVSLLGDDDRNADAFMKALPDSVSFKEDLKELTSEGNYALFEDDRPIIIKNMDDIMYALFDFYSNFLEA